MAATDKDIFEKLKIMAYDAAKKSYSPYSNCQVGAALYTKNNQFFSGANVENSSYGATICAEQTAIFKAVFAEEYELTHLYIFSRDEFLPCGICRQVMSEFAHPSLKIGLEKEGELLILRFFEDIYPLSFSKKDMKLL